MRGWWLALVLAGCYSPSPPANAPCAANGACPAGQRCDLNLDVPVCVIGDAGLVDARDGEVASDAPSDATASALVMHLKFDDLPNDTALDSAGAHVATCGQRCPRLAAGRIGGGYQYLPDMWIAVQDAADLHPSPGFTVAAWARITDCSDELLIVRKADQTIGNTFWLSFLEQGTKCRIYTLLGATSAIGTIEIEENQFHHVALTFDGMIARTYVDGVQVSSVSVPTIHADDSLLYIGGYPGALADQFLGVIDDVRFYDRALSAEDISALAN